MIIRAFKTGTTTTLQQNTLPVGNFNLFASPTRKTGNDYVTIWLQIYVTPWLHKYIFELLSWFSGCIKCCFI